MCKITFQLFQVPQIFLDGKPVVLPFKKAEALLYFLAVKKNISREEAATLLWDNNDEQVAKKNLRHTLYTIKKEFQIEPIVSPKKQILMLNPELDITIDYDQFLQENRTDLYKGEFLQGFYIKNAEGFEEWMDFERARLKESYLHMLYDQMLHIPDGDVSAMESAFSSYIEEDSLDERVYQMLMEFYQRNHLYHKGIKVYQNLSHLLDEELGIAPGADIVKLHRELLNSWTQSTSEEPEPDSADILGRTREFQFLLRAYHNFISGTSTAIFLTGENGVGKTYLMNHFLDGVDRHSSMILRAICFQQEKDFLFQPWNAIMLQLDRYIQEEHIPVPSSYLADIAGLFPLMGSSSLSSHIPDDVIASYNYRATRNSILKVFSLIGAEHPIILSFDNIQYMDHLSLELLSLLIREQNPNIMILGTCPDVLPKDITNYTHSLIKEKFLTTIMIKPFSKEDVFAIIRANPESKNADTATMERIYEETEGNALFLDILLADYSSNSEKPLLPAHAQDLLMDRVAELSTDARQVLDTISISHNFSTLEIMEYILNRDTLEIIDLVDVLKQHGLIDEEVHHNQIHFKFRHLKMQEFIHSQLSPSKQRILHARIAAYLEQRKGVHNNTWYQDLIYHFRLSGNEAKVLQYKILNLEEYSRYNFELFPVLHPSTDSDLEAPKQITEYFEELSSELTRLYHYQPNAIDFAESEARLFHLASKYFISQGEYDKGVSYIYQIIDNNQYIEEHPLAHISYLRQLTFYGIQTWKTDLMKGNIEKCMTICKTHNLNTDYAIECRLYGLYLSMCGKFQEANESLHQAIELLQSTPMREQSLGLNIAACYLYLGEIQRKQQNFVESINFYNKAIQTCNNKKCPQNPTFYSNKARALLALSNYEEAVEALTTANQLYDDSYTLVGRSTARGYYAILQATRGHFDQAVRLYQEAEQCATKIFSPQELIILYRIKTILLQNYPKAFSTIITEDASTCTEQSNYYLNQIHHICELSDLNDFDIRQLK